jgi:regulator of replication initiation timing
MKKMTIFVFVIATMLIMFTGCTHSSADIDDFEKEIDSLQEENDRLQTENDSLQVELKELKNQVNGLENRITEKKNQNTVHVGDVTVGLIEKSETIGKYNDYYITMVFSITNYTDKAIKGVQGVAKFKDLFGVEIISVGCDFTGNTIESMETITVDDLSFDCNKFMDDHMKLYNSDLDDLQFEYTVTSIVFTDGTSKQGN